MGCECLTPNPGRFIPGNNPVESSWNVMTHGDAREGKWRGNWRMEWVTNTLHTTSEHGLPSITTADAHTSAASSRLNWLPRRFKWTRPFRWKAKSVFCACAITFHTQSTHWAPEPVWNGAEILASRGTLSPAQQKGTLTPKLYTGRERTDNVSFWRVHLNDFAMETHRLCTVFSVCAVWATYEFQQYKSTECCTKTIWWRIYIDGNNKTYLTLILLMWRIWLATNNASKWQVGFNSAFKGLNKDSL